LPGDTDEATAKAFIFDLDGTLVTFPIQWDRLRADLRKATETDSEFKPLIHDIEAVIAKNPRNREIAFGILDKYEIQALDKVVLHDNVPALLVLLAGRARLSLVTLQGRKVCESLLRKFGLETMFHSSFFREDSLDRVTQLRMANESLGTQVSETVFVGDRFDDYKAAMNLGMRFVMIGDRKEVGADFVRFNSISDYYELQRKT